jgi:hypothetical protein
MHACSSLCSRLFKSTGTLQKSYRTYIQDIHVDTYDYAHARKLASIELSGKEKKNNRQGKKTQHENFVNELHRMLEFKTFHVYSNMLCI